MPLRSGSSASSSFQPTARRRFQAPAGVVRVATIASDRHAAQHPEGDGGSERARAEADAAGRDQDAEMVEGLVAALLLREAVLADDPEGEGGDGRQQQRAAGRREELGAQHGREGCVPAAAAACRPGSPRRPARSAGAGAREPVDQGAERAAQEQRAEPDQRR